MSDKVQAGTCSELERCDLWTRLAALAMQILDFMKQLALPAKSLLGRHGGGAGVAAIDWTALRAPLADDDRVLVSETHVWLRRIPRVFHPRRLCFDFPRAANRLARSWHDPALVDAVLEQLLSDRRGGRLGFPPRIVEELKLLRRFHEEPHECWMYVAATTRRPRPGAARTCGVSRP